jgi:hypothetical protein
MPPAVRYGLGALAAALLAGVATLGIPGGSPVMAVVMLVFFGGLLAAAARRRNWARLALVVLVAVGVALNAMELPLQLDQSRLLAASTLVQTALQVVGAALLLRRSATRWYGAEPPAGTTPRDR